MDDNSLLDSLQDVLNEKDYGKFVDFLRKYPEVIDSLPIVTICLQYGHCPKEMLNFILDNFKDRVKLNYDNENDNPLLYSLSKRDYEISQLLIDNGADINKLLSGRWCISLDVYENEPLINKAISSAQKIEFLDFVLKNGGILSQNGYKPVLYEIIRTARWYSDGSNSLDIDTCKYILNNDKNLDLKSQHNEIILDIAVQTNLEMVKLIVEYGANPNVIYDNGDTVFHRLSRSRLSTLNDIYEILEYLIKITDEGLINRPDKQGKTILYNWICADHMYKFVKLIIKNGGKLNYLVPSDITSKYMDRIFPSAGGPLNAQCKGKYVFKHAQLLYNNYGCSNLQRIINNFTTRMEIAKQFEQTEKYEFCSKIIDIVKNWQ